MLEQEILAELREISARLERIVTLIEATAGPAGHVYSCGHRHPSRAAAMLCLSRAMRNELVG